MGIIDIVSKPPATIVSAPPPLIRSAAMAIDCKPDEQKRLIVIALVSTGRPALMAAARATFMPCSASGMAHPMITSSISAISSPGTRALASLIAAAPVTSGRVFLNVPFGALPTAVRTADTITASLITLSPMSKCPMSDVRSPKSDFGLWTFDFGLISQRFPSFQHVRNPFLSLALSNQTQKGFTFQIQKVLLRDSRLVIQITAGEYPRQLRSDFRIIIGNVARADHLMNAQLQRRQSGGSERENVCSLLWLYISARGQRQHFILGIGY